MASGLVENFAGTDRFLIQRRIGAGGMGVVYQAWDCERETEVALKTIRRMDPGALYQFKQEFRALADLSHPNLVALHELISAGDQWFFTMELVEGVNFVGHVCADPRLAFTDTETFDSSSLLNLQAERSAADESSLSAPVRPLTPPQLDRLRAALGQLAEGVTVLHEARKLHGDIKPSNVLVTGAGRVVLLDFGLVSELDQPHREPGSDEYVQGTASYIAPEHAAGLAQSEASDWYSVGVMLYQCLTGRLPFAGRTSQVLLAKQRYEPPAPCEIVAGVPADLNCLCVDLLRMDPAGRPTGREILERLGRTERVADSRPPLRPALRGSVPFVGRERQLAALNDAFAETRGGRTIVVRMRGRSGVGKSALLSRFVQELTRHEETVVLSGRCYERESVPYKALDSLIDALSRYLMQLGRHEVEALLPRDVAALARVFPVLRRVEAVAEAPRQVSAIPDQQELRRRAFAALRELFARLGDRRPLVLCLDDLQWGDTDSAALLAEMLRPPDPPVLLLVACYRSEDAGTSPFLRAITAAHELPAGPIDHRELEIEPLTEDEARDLALALLGRKGPDVLELAEAAARESRGNPYFVAELLRFVSTGGGLAEPSAAGRGVTLDDVLGRRVHSLPADARRLLEVVAVAGRPLTQEIAHRAASLSLAEQTVLAVLRTGHLVRTTGPGEHDEIETYHDRIRETIVAQLAAGALQGHHRNLARVLEGSGAADPEALAVHFAGAGEPERAGSYYALAADQAAEALAFDRAATLYRRALDMGQVFNLPDRRGRLETCPTDLRALRTKLADALANAGRGADAAREYLAATEGASAAEKLELQRRAAMQSLISGHIDDGLAALGNVLDAVGMTLAPTPRRALLSLLYRRAVLRARGLKFRERDASQVSAEDLTRIDICWSVAVGLSIVDTVRGADFQTRNLLLSLKAGEPYRVARGLAWEAAHVATLGTPARRRIEKLLETAHGLAGRIGHPHTLGLATLSTGIAGYMQGRWKEAREFSERAEAIFRDQCTGVAWEIDTAQSFILWSLFFLGEVAELSRRLPVILKEARERGDLYAATNLGTFVGYLTWLAADDPAGARRDLHRVMQDWSQQGFHVQHLTGLMAETQIDLYCGDGVSAWRRLQERWADVRGSFFLRVQTVRIFMQHLRGRSALAAAAETKHPEPLIRSAERDARRIERERVAWARPMAQLLRAGIAAGRGDRPRAATLLAEAGGGFERLDMPLFAAAARRRSGEVLGGDEGRTLIAAADAWMAGQAIKNPQGMTAQHAPGFPA